MRFIRKAGAPAEKSPKRLLVEPAELARKLVKEMDDHVLERGDELWARNRYTIYLCPEDYQNLAQAAPRLIPDLKAKLAKHAADEEYLVQGDLIVEMVQDDELELGYFGILAQKGGVKRTQPQEAEAAIVPPPTAEPRPVQRPATSAGPRPAAAGGVGAAAGAGPTAPAAPQASAGPTQLIPPEQADQMGLEGRILVVSMGDQVMHFRQSRVIIGRSKEADLRVNDPNVSRKHAAIYWNNGRVMIDDLGSTNGTMVNGYPVTRTMLRPADVVAIGESRLTVEGK